MPPARLARSGALCLAAALFVFDGCDCSPLTIYVENDAQVTYGDACSAGAAGCGAVIPPDGGGGGDAAVPGDGAAIGPEDDTCVSGAEDCGDGGAPDAEGPDGGAPDAGSADGGTGADASSSCAPGDQLMFGLSPMGGAAEYAYSETVQVTYKGISLPGGTCSLLYLGAAGTPQELRLCYNLPFGYEIPVKEGELVDVLFTQKALGEAVHQKLFVWDQDQVLRFLAYSGDPIAFDPVECADPRRCPVPGYAASDCVPADDACGKAVHPPIAFFMGGGACDRTVQQGEAPAYRAPDASCPPIARGRLVAARSMLMTENSCLDYPDRWLSALVFNNTKVSQCLCRGHDDCAPGEACETEAGRCVPVVAPEVPCEAGQEPDPYTGACFLPFDQSNLPCATTADCAASNAGVCNTWWKESYGTGFCQKNPCEVMDCAWACAPLVGACYECLSDCGCYVPEGVNQRCDQATHACVP